MMMMMNVPHISTTLNRAIHRFHSSIPTTFSSLLEWAKIYSIERADHLSDGHCHRLITIGGTVGDWISIDWTWSLDERRAGYVRIQWWRVCVPKFWPTRAFNTRNSFVFFAVFVLVLDDSVSLSAVAAAFAKHAISGTFSNRFVSEGWRTWSCFCGKVIFDSGENALFWQFFSSNAAQMDSFLIVWGLIFVQATFFTGSPTTYFSFFGR